MDCQGHRPAWPPNRWIVDPLIGGSWIGCSVGRRIFGRLIVTCEVATRGWCARARCRYACPRLGHSHQGAGQSRIRAAPQSSSVHLWAAEAADLLPSNNWWLVFGDRTASVQFRSATPSYWRSHYSSETVILIFRVLLFWGWVLNVKPNFDFFSHEKTQK